MSVLEKPVQNSDCAGHASSAKRQQERFERVPGYDPQKSRIALAFAEFGEHQKERGDYQQAFALFQKALSYDQYCELAKSGMTWLETHWSKCVPSSSACPKEGDVATQSAVWLKPTFIDKGIYVVGQGIVLRSYPFTDASRLEAIGFAQELAEDYTLREMEVSDALKPAFEYVLVYEMDDQLKLIHESTATD